MPNLLIPQAEWLKLTSIVGRIRSKELKAIDTALANHEKLKTQTSLDSVKTALDAWKAKEGANWAQSARNKKYHAFERLTGLITTGADTDAAWTSRGPNFMHPHFEHSRLGVIYLLGHLNVRPDIFNVVLEGGLNVVGSAMSYKGGAYATGATIAAPCMVGGNALLGAINSGAMEAAADGDVLQALRGPAPASDERALNPPNPKTWTPPAPTTARRPAPTPVMRPRPAGSTGPQFAEFTGGVAGGVFDNFDKTAAEIRGAMPDLRTAIQRFCQKTRDAICEKLKSPDFYLGCMKSIATACVSLLLKTCAQAGGFLSAAQDTFKGIVNFTDACGTRVKAYVRSKNTGLQLGHPETVSQSIKGAMDVGILEGFWQFLKGAGNIALNFATAGTGVIVGVVTALFEMIVKLIWRLVEAHKMKKVFREAAELWRNRNDASALHKRPFAFHEWYRDRILHLPCLSVLTLNSGICGDKMTWLSMFSDPNTPISTERFYNGVRYLDWLKIWGVGYLNKTGYVFSGRERFVHQLVAFAKSHSAGVEYVMKNGTLEQVSAKSGGEKVWNAVKMFANA